MRADHRNSHEKTHSTEKEFKCLICNKSFRRADEAKRHEQRQIHLRNVARLEKKKEQELKDKFNNCWVTYNLHYSKKKFPNFFLFWLHKIFSVFFTSFLLLRLQYSIVFRKQSFNSQML